MTRWTIRYWSEKDTGTEIGLTRHITTDEAWYPTINGLLRLSICYRTSAPSALARICIWGGDDFGGGGCNHPCVYSMLVQEYWF